MVERCGLRVQGSGVRTGTCLLLAVLHELRRESVNALFGF